MTNENPNTEPQLNENNINEKQMKLNAVLMSQKYILVDAKTASVFAEGVSPEEAMRLLILTHTSFSREYIKQVVYDTLIAAQQAVAEPNEQQQSEQA